MTKIVEILTQMKNDWCDAKAAIHRGIEIPFKLRCSFGEGAGEQNFSDIETTLPSEAKELYLASDGAILYKDDEYGQWGLKIYSLDEVANMTKRYFEERRKDAFEGDLIIGEFFGDSDLLLLRCNPQNSDFGSVIIVSAIEPRSDWDIAAKNLENFLMELYSHQGDKFWELDRSTGGHLQLSD